MGVMARGVIVAAVVGVIVLITIILLAVSFKGVHYYEYGFLRTVSTGEIDGDRVYGAGLFSVGPNKEFFTFPADANNVMLSSLDVATKDENTIVLRVTFQYKLRKDELNNLRLKYNDGYEEIIKSTATEVIKQTTTRFTNREFLRERQTVEDALADAVMEILESKCCAPTCPASGYCKKGCIQPDKCTNNDRRQYVEFLSLQLADIDLSKELADKFLTNILLDVDEEKAQLDQNVTLIETQTSVLVNQVNIKEKEVRQNSSAQADLIRAKAVSDAREIVENARIAGLSMLFNMTGLTADKEMNMVNYIRALKDMKSARINVNFDTLFRQN